VAGNLEVIKKKSKTRKSKDEKDRGVKTDKKKNIG